MISSCSVSFIGTTKLYDSKFFIFEHECKTNIQYAEKLFDENPVSWQTVLLNPGIKPLLSQWKGNVNTLCIWIAYIVGDPAILCIGTCNAYKLTWICRRHGQLQTHLHFSKLQYITHPSHAVILWCLLGVTKQKYGYIIHMQSHQNILFTLVNPGISWKDATGKVSDIQPRQRTVITVCSGWTSGSRLPVVSSHGRCLCLIKLDLSMHHSWKLITYDAAWLTIYAYALTIPFWSVWVWNDLTFVWRSLKMKSNDAAISFMYDFYIKWSILGDQYKF